MKYLICKLCGQEIYKDNNTFGWAHKYTSDVYCQMYTDDGMFSLWATPEIENEFLQELSLL